MVLTQLNSTLALVKFSLYQFTHLLINPLTHKISFTKLLNLYLAHSVAYFSIHSLTNSLTNFFINFFDYLFINSHSNSLIYKFIHLPVHSPIYTFSNWLICPLTNSTTSLAHRKKNSFTILLTYWSTQTKLHRKVSTRDTRGLFFIVQFVGISNFLLQYIVRQTNEWMSKNYFTHSPTLPSFSLKFITKNSAFYKFHNKK